VSSAWSLLDVSRHKIDKFFKRFLTVMKFECKSAIKSCNKKSNIIYLMVLK
jgi:hypothetical protein